MSIQRIASIAEGRGEDQYAPPSVHEVLRSPGQPLEPATRRFMEQRFGHDFSGVRVHTNDRAEQSTREVNALAYTVGNHIVFRKDYYRPQSILGRSVLTHELTHVVQQKRTNPLSDVSFIKGMPSQRLEAEANSAAVQYYQSPAGRLSAQAGVVAPAVQTLGPLAVGGIAAGVIAALAACAYGFYRYALSNYSGRQGYNDKFMHCYTSCKIASHCASLVPGLGVPSPFSVGFSESAGILKEVADYIKDNFGIGTPADAEWEDWFANQFGIACSLNLLTPCTECCRSAPGAVSPP
jgi:hypothetical protein